MNVEEIIRHYKTLFQCEQYVVTGSYALKRMGLVNKSDDIDIILVNPTQETQDTLARLEKEYPAKTHGSGDTTIFMHEDTKIDVFIENAKIETLQVDGFEISTAKKIINAKKRMGRPKDYVQLSAWRQNILSEKEWYEYVSKFK